MPTTVVTHAGCYGEQCHCDDLGCRPETAVLTETMMASCTSVTMLMLSGSLGSYMMLLGAYSLSLVMLMALHCQRSRHSRLVVVITVLVVGVLVAPLRGLVVLFSNLGAALLVVPMLLFSTKKGLFREKQKAKNPQPKSPKSTTNSTAGAVLLH